MEPPPRNHVQRRNFFWCLFAAQIIGSQAILWTGLPIYWRLLSGKDGGASLGDFLIAVIAIVGMQAAYWLAFSIQQHVQFGRNVLVGHTLLWFSEIAYFFPSALAALVFFDRFRDLEKLEFVPERLAILAGVLFAVFCFKRQLQTLGESFMGENAQPDSPQQSKAS